MVIQPRRGGTSGGHTPGENNLSPHPGLDCIGTACTPRSAGGYNSSAPPGPGHPLRSTNEGCEKAECPIFRPPTASSALTLAPFCLPSKEEVHRPPASQPVAQDGQHHADKLTDNLLKQRRA